MKFKFAIFLFLVVNIVNSAPPRAGYEDATFRASYYMPTAHHLAKYSSWPLKGFKWTVTKNKVRGTYYLPEVLVGASYTKFTFEGTINPKQPFFTLSGNLGQGRCTMYDKDNYACLFRFKNLKLDMKSITDHIKKVSQNAKLKNNRIKVAQFFMSDPIGVINVRRN